MRLTMIISTAVLTLLLCHPAFADDMFLLQSGTDTISFELPATPTNYVSDDADQAFFVGISGQPIAVTLDGITENSGIEFFSEQGLGGLCIFDITTGDPYVFSDGPQLFSGTVNDPGSFLIGETLQAPYEGYSPPSVYDEPFDLTIAAAPTPEPAGVALLGTGLLGIAAIRRRLG